MNNREVAHLWAAQSRASAKGNNFSFDGPLLFSYSTCIARIFPDKAGACAAWRGPIALMTERQYSKTTAKHKNYARNAVSHMLLAEVLHCDPANRREHGANMDYLLAQIADQLKQAQRAQRLFRVQGCREWAERLHGIAGDYNDYFRLRRKVAPLDDKAWREAVARVQRIENPDPASADKRERAKAARIAAREVREKKARELEAVYGMAARSDWRLGHPWGGNPLRSRTDPCMLRINGDEIETSQGARIPLAAAPMVWNMVQHALRHGVYDYAGRGPRVGDYRVDRIDADGTLHAGCHTIPYSELATMARALGLQS